MAMINFHELYESLSRQAIGSQKKIPLNSALEVFFGYNFDGNLRLSFLSKSAPPAIESTQILHVVQGREHANTYWTSFDLLNIELREAYFSFCENIIDSVTGITEETAALTMLRRRFVTWKALFKKHADDKLSREKLLGYFGELITLKYVIAPKYGISEAVKSWGGPDMHSKDFTIDSTWYEVKTIGANADLIHISSLTQLASQYEGHLIVVKVETVSPQFAGQDASLIEVIKSIILQIPDEATENLFIQKLQAAGIDFTGNELGDKYDTKSISSYRVVEGFPRITPTDVPYSEITRVEYSISTASISRFAEG